LSRESQAPENGRSRAPLVIAHRGASKERPENTLPAYALALAQRADMIEIDLHRTRDGAIVIAHDERLPGLSGGGEIADATLAEVRALDVGDGERVPTLDEVLDGFAARIPFNLELKCGSAGPYAGLEVAVLAALAERGLGSGILFSSFHDGVLGSLRAAGPAARIGVLVSPRAPEGWPERCAAVGAQAVHFWKGLATAEAVADAHDRGLAVHVYTVDDPEEMRTLLDRGCDGLFTNYPARMRALLESAHPGGHSRSRD
jgi:glycerophosphoryl diester phosphodiesterase